mmetsp:Transcript_81372/g.143615  ORF Transcript_81372/g.143615 Transcript_81372/m.143615 type:complete len:616 (-) Transcript_81372:95-1942(-)
MEKNSPLTSGNPVCEDSFETSSNPVCVEMESNPDFEMAETDFGRFSSASTNPDFDMASNPEMCQDDLVSNPSRDFGSPKECSRIVGRRSLEFDAELNDQRAKLEYRVNDFWNIGLTVDKLVIGFVLGCLYPAQNGILLGYLNMEGYLFRSSKNMWESPRIFMVIFGILSDSKPIRGRRRGPYMAIGWALTFLALCMLSSWPLPSPYYCANPDGSYDYDLPPCNPSARHEYVAFVIMFAMINLGTQLSIAASNGLLVEFAKAEPEAIRGTTQMYILVARKTGEFASAFLTGFAFNGKMFNGGWDQRYQLNFTWLCRILTVPAGLAFLSCCFCIREPTGCSSESSFRGIAKSVWRLMSKKSFFFVSVWTMAGSVVTLGTPATYFVALQWAGVKNLQNQLASLVGICTTAIGIWVFKRYFLETNWRKLIVAKTFTCIIMDGIPIMITVFDVFRNQYFFLGEPLLDHIITAGLDVQNMLLTNEISDNDNAGLVGGLLATMFCLASPFSGILSNQVFGLFTPSLSNRDNFIADTMDFRIKVALSVVITWAFSIASLAFLPFMPSQKKEARQWTQDWPSHHRYAFGLLSVLIFTFVYQMLVEFMSMNPDLACMQFVGGEGC